MARKLAHEKTNLGASREIVGFIDAVDENGISGWAYDKLAPQRPVILGFHIDDSFVADIPCKAHRQDVGSAGHPTSEVGFRAVVPQAYCDGRPHVFYFRDEAGNDVVLGGCGEGTLTVRPFQIDTYFDAAFYAQRYMAGLSEEWCSELEHWKRSGAQAGYFPNPDALLAQYAADGNVLPADFSADYYRFLNRDISDALRADWQAKLHYLEVGKRESRSYRMEVTDFVTELFFDGKKQVAGDIEKTLELAGIYTSLPDMLVRNKVYSDTFLKIFDFAAYAAHAMPASFRTKLQCIRHFLEVGIPALSPISAELVFDPGFYREAAELEGIATVSSDVDAYLHWLNYGIDKSVAPNGAAALRQFGLTERASFPSGFDHRLYRARNPDREDLWYETRWRALGAVIDSGLAEGRLGCPLDDTTREVYRVAADRQAVTRSYQSAKLLYEQVLATFPDDTMSLRHYADCLLQLEDFFQAAVFYKKTIASGRDNPWTHLNLTTCLLNLKQWTEAAQTIGRLAEKRPGDWAIAQRYHEVVQQGFDALSDDATWLARNGFYAESQTRIAQACHLLTERLSREAPVELPYGAVKRVAIIADIGLPQCKFYRVTQKCEQLTEAGIGWQVFDYMNGTQDYINSCGSFDAAIFYRVPAIPSIVRAIEAARRAGQPTFYEIDDLMFDPEKFPPPFETYGGQISHDIYASLVTGAVTLKHALSICDFAIASTTALAAAMAPHSLRKRAFVHRNGLGKTHMNNFDVLDERPRAELRLFYGSGTKAHNEDFTTELAPSLLKLFAKHGDAIRLVIMGYLTLPDSLAPYAHRITRLDPIWDIEQYWNVLRSMSINLAVLTPGDVADCKSEIKWLEAAMMGVPSVVTATATYQDVVRDGETGMLVRSAPQWFSAIDELICSPAKRRTIGARARAEVLKTYSMASLSANIATIFDQSTGGRLAASTTRRIRVLVVNVFFAPQSMGGATRVVIDNVRDLREIAGDELEFEIFTTTEGATEPYRPTTYRWEGIRVTGVTTPNEPDIESKVTDPEMGAAFEATIKRFAPDIIHFHCIQRLTTSLCSIATQAGVPYFITVHDGWWISDRQFIVDEFGNNRLYQFKDPLAELQSGNDASFRRMLVKQKCLKGAAKIFAVSEAFARIYRECGFENVVTVENGLPPFRQLPRTVSPDGRVRLAHIGGASFHKGFNLVTAVLSMGKFPNLKLITVDLALESGTERSVMWGATEVVFRAKVPQADVGELYAQIDVLLAPSLWPESYGLVAREALAAGCWVVASDRGAIGQDVPAKAGFLIDVTSHDALRRVFQRMNDDPATYTRSPRVKVALRTARDQALELADYYRGFKPSRGKENEPAPPTLTRIGKTVSRAARSGVDYGSGAKI
jgi:glycosyltransferase involved in cell wall biosynthesis/tetratricopeptide (TPR) repeat protein